MTDLAKLAGPVFDAIFQHVDGPPPSPVAANVGRFRRMGRGSSRPSAECLLRLPGRDRQGNQSARGRRGR